MFCTSPLLFIAIIFTCVQPTHLLSPSKTTPLDLILLLFFSIIIIMKISALASLLGVAATTLLPGVSASEVVSDVPYLLYVRLCVALCRTLCYGTHNNVNVLTT